MRHTGSRMGPTPRAWKGRRAGHLGWLVAILAGLLRRKACAIGEEIRELGIEIRAGLHTGEVEVRGEGLAGIAVHIGARIAALASAQEVLVSSTVRDLVAGSGISFLDRGWHELKGVPEKWRLFSVEF